MASLVTLCSGTFCLLILAASVGLPKLIVPNHPDLTIKIRRTSDDWSQVDTLYLKGARERTEIVIEKLARPDNIKSAVIRQCDKMRSFVLNERDKIYATSAIEDWSERLKKARPVNLPQVSGGDVQETIDSIDTGERREFGRYTSRHVKGRIQIEPSPGASTPASVETVDGWYVDLPGFGCQDRASTGFTVARLRVGNVQDRLQITWLGKAPRGYPIEETSVIAEVGRTMIRKVELLEISEAPLDPSIFELPVGYRLALQTGNGSADLTKPDTIPNRAQYYWARLTFWVRGLFR